MLDLPTRTNKIGLDFGEFYADHNVYHPGVDWNFGYGDQDRGQPVTTITYGVVEYVSPRGTNGGLGNYVVIYHPWHAAWTRFLHLDEVFVRIGQILPRNTVIGLLGDSGTTSPHLHGEVLNWKGLNYIKNWHRPYGRYPKGLSKAEMMEMWIDPQKFINEQQHPPETSDLERRLAQARKAIVRAKGARKLRLQRFIERVLARIG